MSLDSVKEKENHFKSSHSEECIVGELDCKAVEMVGGAGKGDGSTDWELSLLSVRWRLDPSNLLFGSLRRSMALPEAEYIMGTKGA